MTIIAAITKDHALGRAGDMIYHLPDDLRRFKALTMGHPLVMGRNTFESFPNGPLPGRRNLVVTHNAEYKAEGIETYTSLTKALRACSDASPMIIGGGQIYAQAMPLAKQLLITEIDAEAKDADTFFPEIDSREWEIIDVSEWAVDARSGVRYRHLTYVRTNNKL